MLKFPSYFFISMFFSLLSVTSFPSASFVSIYPYCFFESPLSRYYIDKWSKKIEEKEEAKNENEKKTVG